jgi:hypothetical protein
MASRSVPGTKVKKRARGTWHVRADHMGSLRQLATASVGAGPIYEATVRLDRWRRPRSGWVGNPGIAGLDRLTVQPVGDGVEVALALREPRDVGVVLSSVVRVLQPTATGFLAPTWTEGVQVDGILAEHIHDVRVDGDEQPHVRRADVLLVEAARYAALRKEFDAVTERVITVNGTTWGDRQVLLDPTIHRPHRRASDAQGDIVDASFILDQYSSGIQMIDVKPLRSISAVTGASALPDRLRAQLSALGIVLVDSAEQLPGFDDFLEWQARSVAGRRDALRNFSPWPAVQPWPTVSIVLATHRPDRLEHALAMVRRQSYPHLQAVIALHGNEEDVAQQAPRVRSALDGWNGEWALIGVPAERTLGQVLGAASARADGELITKMDDDDFYSKEHVWDLVLARMYSGAQIVGKALDWIYLSHADTTVFRPTYAAECFATFVAGGTMLISAGDLAQIGGWRPVPRSVDRALLDRVMLDGGLVYRTHGLGYVYVRSAADGSANTSAVHESHFLKKTSAQFPGLLRSIDVGTQEDEESVS